MLGNDPCGFHRRDDLEPELLIAIKDQIFLRVSLARIIAVTMRYSSEASVTAAKLASAGVLANDNHPHITFRHIEENPNVIYIAYEKFATDSPVRGWGAFPKFREELRLTHQERCHDKRGKQKQLPSRWQLPASFYNPNLARQPLK